MSFLLVIHYFNCRIIVLVMGHSLEARLESELGWLPCHTQTSMEATQKQWIVKIKMRDEPTSRAQPCQATRQGFPGGSGERAKVSKIISRPWWRSRAQRKGREKCFILVCQKVMRQLSRALARLVVSLRSLLPDLEKRRWCAVEGESE